MFFTLFVITIGVSGAKASEAFDKEVRDVRALLDEVRGLKANNDARWKPKVYEAYGRLKPLLCQDRSSGEVYLLYVRCYWYNDRLRKAEKSFDKAYFFDHDNIEILIFTGKMYSAEVKKYSWISKHDMSNDYYHAAREAYKSALKVEGVEIAT